jgi:AraC-like DNA-binding protein
LSPIINQYYKSNFSSWLNKYRVNYFIELIGHEEKRELTLEALARESGFANRTTFMSAFRKEKNTTPGAFLHQHPVSS